MRRREQVPGSVLPPGRAEVTPSAPPLARVTVPLTSGDCWLVPWRRDLIFITARGVAELEWACRLPTLSRPLSPGSPPAPSRRLYSCGAPSGRDRLLLPGSWGASRGRRSRPPAPRPRSRMSSPTTATTRPLGCNRRGLDATYFRLCDTSIVWGIVLEALAALGAVTTVAFIVSLLVLVCKVQDSTKRKLLPTQFLFLLGVLGIFGLTFAFIIYLDHKTGPTRFFLFGVLFALCFSCLLAHALTLTRLVHGRKPLSLLVTLALAVGLSLVQDIIAVEYVVLTMNRTNTAIFAELPSEQRNQDFVMLLIYVLFLMALTFLTASFTFRGAFSGWKRHGAHIYLTTLLSIAIWVAWITLLLHYSFSDDQNDTILSVVLVANGWVFLLAYVIPEFCRLTKQQNPMDYPVEDAFCKPQHMKQSYGVENRAYAQEEITQGLEEMGDALYAPYSTHFQLQPQSAQKDFSIPRAQMQTSPYNNYEGRKDGS